MRCPDTYTIDLLWILRCTKNFNALTINNIFGNNGIKLIVGCEDGVVRIYNLPDSQLGGSSDAKPSLCLETKGGPVQTLCIYDVTKFYDKDLLVGDSTGMLTVFCNQQILSRHRISEHSIDCMQIQQMDGGGSSTILSAEAGLVTSILSSSHQWRINLNDFNLPKGRVSVLKVLSLLAADITTAQGHSSSYILVGDNSGHLHVFREDSLVQSIPVPASVTAMCCGTFLPPSKLSLPFVSLVDLTSPGKESTQVALATATGAIYILYNFMISEDEFANTGLPILHLVSVTLPKVPSDYLFCAGHFNSVNVFLEGKKLVSYPLPDWVSCIDTADVDGDKTAEVIVGCLDNSIHALKLIPP